MTELTDLSPIDANNDAVGAYTLDGALANMSTMDDTLQAILGIFGRASDKGTIASATTTNIGAAPQSYLEVTGTATITGLGTVRNGTIRVLRFSGILTLTYNATSLILPGGVNRVTVAGDTAVFVSEGSGNWRCLSYNPASGLPVVSPTPAPPRGYIFGLTLSNNSTDATNDIDIAAGAASSEDTTPVLMSLASALTKRLDAAWAVGTGNGGLDTGAIGNNTYHVWLIRRSDTGVVDALFSLSATSPTMPTSYDQKRRVGSIIRASGAILLFEQVGDVFYKAAPTVDISATNPGTSAVTYTLPVPIGIEVIARGRHAIIYSTSGAASNGWLLSDLSLPDLTPDFAVQNTVAGGFGFNLDRAVDSFDVRTNTSGQVRGRLQTSTSVWSVSASVTSWVDTRGREA